MTTKLELGIPTPPPNAKAFKLTAIALVAIQHNGKWCATHETRGWYMPAGRIDFGESVETGARREALEEAGIPVTLLNIVRVEFTPGFYTRLRVLYYAVPTNPEIPLRDITQRDDEIVEAKWVEPEELRDGRLVRTNEMTHLFSFLNTRPYLAPTSLVDSIDGYPIDHSKVTTAVVLSATLVISNPSKTVYYFPPGDGEFKYDLLHYFTVPSVKMINNAAKEHLKLDLNFVGVLKVRFLPPHSQFPHRPVGYLNIVYYVVVDDLPLFDGVNVDQLINQNAADRLLNDYNYNLFLSTLNNETVYPLNVVTSEGSGLVNLR